MAVKKEFVNTKMTIKCPHCGCEYHPSEIYYPGDLLGKPDSIVKDAIGKILLVDSNPLDEPSFEEHFICDQCNKPFIVEAQVSYRTRKEESELDFTETSTSLLD